MKALRKLKFRPHVQVALRPPQRVEESAVDVDHVGAALTVLPIIEVVSMFSH
jgi:hypothetical protein